MLALLDRNGSYFNVLSKIQVDESEGKILAFIKLTASEFTEYFFLKTQRGLHLLDVEKKVLVKILDSVYEGDPQSTMIFSARCGNQEQIEIIDTIYDGRNSKVRVVSMNEEWIEAFMAL